MTVETAHAGELFPGSTEDIRQFLEDKGYVHVYTIAGELVVIESVSADLSSFG